MIITLHSLTKYDSHLFFSELIFRMEHFELSVTHKKMMKELHVLFMVD